MVCGKWTPERLRRAERSTPKRKYCPDCGEPIVPTEAFCPNCGRSYDGTDDSLCGYSISCKCGGPTQFRLVKRGQYRLRAWVCQRCGREIIHPEDKQRFMFRSLFSTRFWGY